MAARSLLFRSNTALNSIPLFPGWLENLKSRSFSLSAIAKGDGEGDASQHPGNLGLGGSFGSFASKESRPMDFIRGVINQDGYQRNSRFNGNQPPYFNKEHDADFVVINIKRNNTFVTVTDSKGQTKKNMSASSGMSLKGAPKLSRYAAEATAEFVGRKAREVGLKSVVVKVKGFTYFRKKRQAIMSFKEGFSSSRDNSMNPVVYVEDGTRRAHNGCRLRKQRRI